MESTSNGVGAPQFGLLQDAITRVNEAIIDLILTAARLREAEPLGAAILGLSDEALAGYSSVRKFDLMQANKFGIPLFLPRIRDPETLRTIMEKGMGEATVLRLLNQSLPLTVIEKKKK